MRGNCPFCEIRTGKPDKKQCLGLHVVSAKWHCFRCGTGGLLQEMPDDLTSFRPDVAEVEQHSIEAPDGFVELYREPGWSSISCDEPRAYLRGRGLDDDLGFDARIGAVLSGCGGGCEPRCIRCKLKSRVVVPIFDVEMKEWLGWSARAWYKDAFRKYLYPPGMQRAALLYNHAALHVETDEPAYIVEGVFDALALWPDGVAVLGKPSSFQLEALITARRPVVVALDGDAWREAEVLAQRLRFEGQQAGFVRLQKLALGGSLYSSGNTGSLDPDELDQADLRQRGRDSLLITY